MTTCHGIYLSNPVCLSVLIAYLQNSGFIQLSDVTLTAWKGGHGRQSEWSLQAVWVALKSFETQGQGGSAIRLDTDKSTDKKDIQKKTRILSNDVL